jgi:hypothetical protein
LSLAATRDKDVARLYAGILGLLAFLTNLIRGMVHGYGAESTLWSACLSMALFAVVGVVLGGLARWIVEDSVNSRLAAELAAQAGGRNTPGKTPAAAEKTGA